MQLTRTDNLDFCDIVALRPKSKEMFIFDPTIRYETNNINQDDEICREKQETYEKCFPFLNEKYALKYGLRKRSVQGLRFGTRGTVGA